MKYCHPFPVVRRASDAQLVAVDKVKDLILLVLDMIKTG